MSTLIINDDRHSTEALQSLLRSMGRTPLTLAQDLDEARQILINPANRIGLILAQWRPASRESEIELPLIREVLSHPRLHAAPLVLMFEKRSMLGFLQPEVRAARVDAHLFKPFGRHRLSQAVRAAFVHRARSRHTLLLVGDDHKSALESALLPDRADSHWKHLLVAPRLPQAETLSREAFQIGAWVVDPSSIGEKEVAWITRFKKTPRGLLTPIACLGRDIQKIGRLRLCCDLFVEPPRAPDLQAAFLTDLLVELSRRVTRGWHFRQDLTALRRNLRTGDTHEAHQTLKRMARTEGSFWECQEAAGDLKVVPKRRSDSRVALRHYERALESNPFSARSHLGRIELLSGERRTQALAQATLLCPGHPQILKFRERIEERGS